MFERDGSKCGSFPESGNLLVSVTMDEKVELAKLVADDRQEGNTVLYLSHQSSQLLI